MSDNIITNISGFPEFSPEAQIVFNKAVSLIRESYEACGALPLETAAIERVEHIESKGGNDKEIYGLTRLKAEDKDANGYALHFDLTLPLARYVSQNYHRLHFPFKRYQIQPVWRGERAQNKRFRQFYQCDIDVIGDGTLSITYDAEMPAVIYQIFKKLDIGPFKIRINNRKILTGLLSHFGVVGDDNIMKAINIIDDLEKVGLKEVTERLCDMDVSEAAVQELVSFFDLDSGTDELIDYLKTKDYGEIFHEGLTELASVIDAIRSFGVPDNYFEADITIARGLDYYTGTVYETQLINNPDIGSICSGGRYDNLTKSFSKKHLPGVGISIGLTRLLAELFDAEVIKVGEQTVTPVLVTTMDKTHLQDYLSITSDLRKAGIKTDLFLEDKKLGKQITYADKKGIPFVLIAGEDEIAERKVTIKNMVTGEQSQANIAELPAHISTLMQQQGEV